MPCLQNLHELQEGTSAQKRVKKKNLFFKDEITKMSDKSFLQGTSVILSAFALASLVDCDEQV